MANIITFYEDDPRYKCCCTKCHSKTGVLIILVLSCIDVLLSLIGFWRGGAYIGTSVVQVLVLAIVVGLGFYALYSEKALFLLPYMLILGVVIVILIIVGIASVVGTFVASDEVEKLIKEGSKGQDLGGYVTVIGVTGGIACLIWAGFCIWYFTIFLACYRYFKEKSSYTPGITMTTTSKA